MKKAVALLAVPVLAACGSAQSVKTLSPIGFGLHYRERGASFSLGMLVSTGKPIPPLTAHLRVFADPRTASDAIPARVRPFMSLHPRIAYGPGRAEPDRSRLLVAAGGERLYAVPTERGAVELVLSSGADYVRMLEHRLVWLSLEQRPAGTTVAGLASNGVTKVDVEIGKDTRAATLGHNGFLLTARGVRANQIDALVVTTSRGRFRLPLYRKEFHR